MRIALTSCFSAESFPDQPVWDEIADWNPDVLVLLGDAIYMDCGAMSTDDVRNLSEGDFADRARKLYTAQVAHPTFSKLVRRPALETYAIWDDHDFLWDNSRGIDAWRSRKFRPFIYASRTAFRCFRETLVNKSDYPAQLPAWTGERAPGYSYVGLGADVHLHLTDGRSWRGSGSVFGDAQIDEMEAVMRAHPDGVHVVASGSVVESNAGECWLNAHDEYQRLLGLALQYRMLVLSGDVHKNALRAIDIQNGRHLYEMTSSGAAVRTLVTIGSLQRNWAWLEIDDQSVTGELRTSGASQGGVRKIMRASWQATAPWLTS